MNPVFRNILLSYVRPICSTGRPRSLSAEVTIDTISYVLRTGCQWRNTPVVGASWQCVYAWFNELSRKHVFERAYKDLLRFYVNRHGLSTDIITDTTRTYTAAIALVDHAATGEGRQPRCPHLLTAVEYRSNSSSIRATSTTAKLSPISCKRLRSTSISTESISTETEPTTQKGVGTLSRNTMPSSDSRRSAFQLIWSKTVLV